MIDQAKRQACLVAEDAKILRRLEKHRRKQALYEQKRSKTYNAEIATIRAEQHHWKRIVTARRGARSVHIAYSFLRGNEYKEIEFTAYSLPNWDSIRNWIAIWTKNNNQTLADFDSWKQRAESWYETGLYDTEKCEKIVKEYIEEASMSPFAWLMKRLSMWANT